MPIKQLSNHTALVPGSELWVLPNDSPWTSRVDWYLNFQISRATNRKPKELTQRQVDDLKEMELPVYEIDRLGANPLMIASSRFLPNSQTLIFDFKDHPNWVENVKRLWTNLKKPSLRLFLPADFSLKDLVTQWPELENIDTTIVESRTSRNT